jgi:hypothetical protein
MEKLYRGYFLLEHRPRFGVLRFFRQYPLQGQWSLGYLCLDISDPLVYEENDSCPYERVLLAINTAVIVILMIDLFF